MHLHSTHISDSSHLFDSIFVYKDHLAVLSICVLIHLSVAPCLVLIQCMGNMLYLMERYRFNECQLIAPQMSISIQLYTAPWNTWLIMLQ